MPVYIDLVFVLSKFKIYIYGTFWNLKENIPVIESMSIEPKHMEDQLNLIITFPSIL